MLPSVFMFSTDESHLRLRRITGCASLVVDGGSLSVSCFCTEKSLESVLAPLNRLRSTKGDAAEIAGQTHTAVFSIFSIYYIYHCQRVWSIIMAGYY